MWIDERGSEVLEMAECRRLLALGAKQHRHGHLGISNGDFQAPTVLPVNYAVADLDVVIVVGEGLFQQVANRMVAFEVDGIEQHGQLLGAPDESRWSVLVCGLAHEETGLPGGPLPILEVAEPGRRVVRIRTDVLTGRKLGRPPGGSPEPHPEAPAGLRLVDPEGE